MSIVYTSATSPATDQTFYFKLVHPSNGQPRTGLTITNLNCVYVRDRNTAVSTALTALAAPNSAHSDNKAIEVSSSLSPGLYRVDFPDAAFATGVSRVLLGVIGAAIDPAYIEIELLTPPNEASVNVSSISNNAITAASMNSDAGSEIADAVWDEALTGATHNVPTSAGRRLRQLGDAIPGTVTDSAPSTTDFDTDLSGYGDNFLNDQLIRFVTGSLTGQLRIIKTFTDTNNNILVSEPLTQAPSNGDTFDVIPIHVHPTEQISAGILDDDVIEGSYTLRQLLRIMSSALFAKASGGGSSTINFRDLDDTKDRIVATVTSEGNRTTVVLDGT